MQLRDAQTSELIAEGTPLEIATLAQQLDPADVLFDDCGMVDKDGRSLFDPQAVRKFRADELAALQAQLDAPAPDGEDQASTQTKRQQIQQVIQERRDRIAAGKAKAATARQAMVDARDRRDKRVARGRG